MLIRVMLMCVATASLGLGQPSGEYPPGKWHEPRPVPRTLNPSTGVHDTGLLTVSIDDAGGQQAWRNSYFWPDTASPDHLFWSWLAVGLGQWSVSDAWDFEWGTTPGGSLVMLEPGPMADEEGLAEFVDTAGCVRVKQQSYAWDAEADEDYIIVAYTVVNRSGLRQDSVLIAHRSDFDVMGDHGGAATDMSGFDSTRMLAYMWDVSSTVHVGVSILSGAFRGYHTGWHSESDFDKYSVMDLPGADPTTPYADDWCIWLSAGPYQLAAGDSFEVAFAFLAGDSLADLQSNADEALAKWTQLSIVETGPARLGIRVATTICRGTLVLGAAPSRKPQATCWLLNIAGRGVLKLHPGANDVSHLAPGVYFVRSAVSVRKVILEK